MTKTLLIGGNGFIGSALADFLHKSRRQVSVLDVTTPLKANSEISYSQGDYGDEGVIKKSLEGVDEVIFLAYSSVPKTSFEDPFKDISENLPRAVTLFKIASSFPLKHFVVMSSGGAVYGPAENLPIKETAPTNPISPYGITKLALEKYALMFAHTNQLPVVITRPSNVYGEGQRPYTGQGFIATAIASCLDEKDITIFGKEGTIRDYIHIDDLIAGIAQVLDKGKIGQIYNIATGIGTSNKEVLSLIIKLTQETERSPKVKYQEKRSFDVPANILDYQKLTQDTGWQPAISLNQGIEQTWQWFLHKYKND